MLVDDAAGRAVQGGGATHLRFHAERLAGRDPANTFHAVGARAFQEVVEYVFLVGAAGDDELAAVLVIDAALLAVGIQRPVPRHAEARLETARRVVQASVDDAAVACRGDRAGVRLPLEQPNRAS